MKLSLSLALAMAFCLALATNGVASQISGVISDIITQQPIAQAEVVLMQKGEIVHMVFTDANGAYTLDSSVVESKQVYEIKVNAYGYKSTVLKVKVGRKQNEVVQHIALFTIQDPADAFVILFDSIQQDLTADVAELIGIYRSNPTVVIDLLVCAANEEVGKQKVQALKEILMQSGVAASRIEITKIAVTKAHKKAGYVDCILPRVVANNYKE